MPEIWQCTDCKLVFTTADNMPPAVVGILDESDFVCNACGTQHELHVAREEPGEPFTIFYEAKLVNVPVDARVRVMSELRKLGGLTLGDARNALATLPFGVGRPVSREDAARVAARLSDLGAESVVDECSRDLNFAHCDELPQDKLMAAEGPLFEIPTGEAGFPRVVREVPGPRSGARGRVDLERQPCGHCGATGTLVTYAGSAPERCPHCGGRRLDVLGLWIT